MPRLRLVLISLLAAVAAQAQNGISKSQFIPASPPGGIGGSCPASGAPYGYLTAAGQVVTCVASAWTVSAGSSGGTVTSVASGNLSPLFTVAVSSPTTAASLAFTLSTAGANSFFGNPSGSTGAPSYMTPTQATANLNLFTTSLQGLVPSGGSSSTVLFGNATWGAPFSLTTTGTSGAATFSAGTLNVPQYASFITSLTTSGTSGAATVTSGVLNIPQYTGGGGVTQFPLSVSGATLTLNSGASSTNASVFCALNTSTGLTNCYRYTQASTVVLTGAGTGTNEICVNPVNGQLAFVAASTLGTYTLSGDLAGHGVTGTSCAAVSAGAAQAWAPTVTTSGTNWDTFTNAWQYAGGSGPIFAAVPTTCDGVNTICTGGEVTVSNLVATSGTAVATALSTSGTVAWNIGGAYVANATITLSGNVTAFNPSNMVSSTNGGYTVFATQGGSAYTLALGTGGTCASWVDLSTGSTVTSIPMPASGTTAFSFTLSGTTCYVAYPHAAGTGTVISVASTFTGGLISISGSPITTSGTLAFTVAGTSGGIPYFSSSSGWASSGALTANLPVIGGGAGSAPTVGTVSGNTTKFGTVSGSLTSGHCLQADASGNLVDSGSSNCGGGGSVAWSGISNATGALSLANAGNATTFNQTSAVNWTWANTTAATSGTAQSSPIFNINGNYWNGSASAADSWTVQDVVANGTNGTSVLTFAHSGTSGAASTSFPGQVSVGSISTGTSPPSVTAGTGGVIAGGEGTAPSVCPAASVDCLYWDSTQHGPLLSRNNGSYLPLPQGPASTTSGNVTTWNAANGGLLADAGFLATNIVRKDATNTGAAAMTLDMSASTANTAFKVPVIAGATASADGVLNYDSTAKITHARTNAADSTLITETSTTTTTTLVLHATAVAGIGAFSAVALSTDVSGLLPCGNGGTGASPSAAGVVLAGTGSGTCGYTATPQFGIPGTTTGNVKLSSSASIGSAFVTLASPTLSTSYTFTFPTTGGTNNYLYATDGSGNGSWTGAPTVSGVNFTSNTIPIASLASLGTGVATFLATPSGANFNSMIAAGGVPISQNSQSTAYTLVLSDGGGSVLHPTADNNARTFTIPANSSVAYPVGTVITFINQINTVTIAITTDTLQLAGTATTGSRTLAAGGLATATKVTSTLWYISGPGLT